jgi:hypothetical protein
MGTEAAALASAQAHSQSTIDNLNEQSALLMRARDEEDSSQRTPPTDFAKVSGYFVVTTLVLILIWMLSHLVT